MLSTPERAVLELPDELPGGETFHQVDMLMAGLTGLSPKRTGRLLGECRRVKVKRLFLWFAERHGHSWLERLERDGIDLGKGKRMLVRVARSTRNTRSRSRRISMPVDERYRRQVELPVRTLPHVAQERCLALKGGTAINLFVRNLPRLSVDIDLTYLPVADRTIACGHRPQAVQESRNLCFPVICRNASAVRSAGGILLPVPVSACFCFLANTEYGKTGPITRNIMGRNTA